MQVIMDELENEQHALKRDLDDAKALNQRQKDRITTLECSVSELTRFEARRGGGGGDGEDVCPVKNLNFPFPSFPHQRWCGIQ